MRFVLSPAAQNDLHDIWDFIARDSVSAADRVFDEIIEMMNTLADMPGMGHRRDDLADETLRALSVRSYLIVYRPDAVPLEVVRIVSGYRDIEALFRR
jgi:plasmid stabilization system protein ParE